MTDETAATNAAGEAIAPESQVPESAPGAEASNPKEDGFTKRIDELTKNWRDTQREVEETKRIAADRERDAAYWRDQALRQQQPAPKAEAWQQPKTPADFEFDDVKYQTYLRETLTQDATAAAKAELKRAQEEEAKERRKATYLQRISEFEKSTPDYREKIRNGVFSDAMAEVITESEEGPAVAYFLASNLNLADSIARLPPLAAARELGRIEANLLAERKAAKKVSDAPPPPPKIEATDPATNKPWNDPGLSQEEFNKRRRQQIAKRR